MLSQCLKLPFLMWFWVQDLSYFMPLLSFILKIYFFLKKVYICICVYVNELYVCVHAYTFPERPEEGIVSLGVGVTCICEPHPVRVLATKLMISGGIVGAFNHGSISLVSVLTF